MMKELSKAEEIARCQDTVTRLILAFRGLDKHDRSGRSKLERQLEEEKSKLLSLGRMVTTVTEPFKQTLHGLWSHYFVGARAERLGIEREYVGCVFGALVETAKGPRYIGGETKMARKGQRYDADGRGSEVVAVARSEAGLDLGAAAVGLLYGAGGR